MADSLMTCTPYGINTHRLIVQARRVAYNGEDDAPAKTVQAVIHYTVRSFNVHRCRCNTLSGGGSFPPRTEKTQDP